MKGKTFLLLFITVIISISVILFSAFSIRAQSKKEMETTISAEIQYEDSPDLFKIQNVQIYYNYYTGASGYVSLGSFYLPALLYQEEVRGITVIKEVLLSDIQEIGEIKKGKDSLENSFTVTLKDGNKIEVKDYNLDGELMRLRFPEIPIYRPDAYLVGGAIIDNGIGKFKVLLTRSKSLSDNKIKSIRFSTSDNQKWAQIERFSTLLLYKQNIVT